MSHLITGNFSFDSVIYSLNYLIGKKYCSKLIFSILFEYSNLNACFCCNSGKSMVSFDSQKRYTSHVIFYFVQLIINI